MKLFAALSLVLPLAAAVSVPAPLEKRTRSCAIVSSAGANCRGTPSTDGALVHTLAYGRYYNFFCREEGGNVPGSTDNYWDFNTDYDCYVWEVLTDDNCSPSALEICPTPGCGRDLEGRRVC